MAGDKLKLFISYSRRDMAAADALVTALEGEGFEITIDRRDLPYGEEWQKELGDFIRGSDTVVWLVSPDSVASKWCNWELGEVGRLHKRLVPVKIRDVAPEELPEGLGRVHLLPVGGAYDPATHLSTLVTTLNTDRGWTKEATRLADRAREWIARERNDGLLLRGAGLKNAEAWSTVQPKAAPPPASEVLELILASRRAALRRHRWTIGGALAVAAVALGLMALAIWQRGIAQTNEVRAVAGEQLAKANEEQAKQERDAALITQSRFLVDQARQADANGDHGTALALALEALPDERRGRIRPYLPAAESMLYRVATTLRERRTWNRISTEDFAKFLPDGQRLITFSNRDPSSRIRDAATGAVLAVLEGHTQGVATVAFSPDGKLIVIGSFDGTVRLWNAANGAPLGTFKGHGAAVRSAAFSPDGRRIVTGSSDGTARIWHAASDTAPPTVLAMPDESVDTAEFSPDGQSITTTSSNPSRLQLSARIWDAESGKLLEVKVLATEKNLFSVFYVTATDGRHVVLIDRHSGGKARIWDIASGGEVGDVPDNVPDADVAFSPDGLRIAIVSANTLKIWEAIAPSAPPTNRNQRWRCNTRQCILELEGDGGASWPVFSPDGQRVAAFVRNTTSIWNANVGDQVVIFERPDRAIAPASFSPDGRQLITLSFASAGIWDATGDAAFRVLHRAEAAERGGPRNVYSFAAFSPDGQTVVTVSGDGTAKIWNTASGALLAKTQCPGGLRAPVRFLADGKRIVTACGDGKLRVWQAASDASPVVLGEDQSLVNSVAVSSDGERIATGTADGNARIWDVSPNPASVLSVKLPGAVLQTSISPAGRQVLLVADARAWLWNGTDATAPAQLGKYADILTASFSIDGGKIVLGQSDHTIRILNAETHAEETAWQAYGTEGFGRRPIATAVFSPDGKRVLTAGVDNTARIYDAATGAEVAVLRGHESDVLSAAFSSNGWIVTTSSDRSVRLWTAFGTTQALIDYARAHMPRELTPEQRQQYFLDPPAVSPPAGASAAATRPR